MKQLSMYDQTLGSTASVADTTLPELAAFHTLETAPEAKRDSGLSYASDAPDCQPEPIPANVTEIIIAKDKSDRVQMLLPMLTHLSQDARWLAWVDPPLQLLKRWREQAGNIRNDDIMIIRSDSRNSALELTQRALRAGTCHAVIVWTEHLSQDQFNALEQASAEGDSHGIVLRSRHDKADFGS
ncbi:MAG: LexA family transcriptional regulator [Oleiphilus sp.]|nr:MAG: LexA family transcriptional regulator [Oleiphilus sp.]